MIAGQTAFAVTVRDAALEPHCAVRFGGGGQWGSGQRARARESPAYFAVR